MHSAIADAARLAEARIATHQRLVSARPLLSPRVAAALLYVPRHPFLPGAGAARSGAGGAVWPEAAARVDPPLAEADLLDALDVRPGHRVLHVGTGSGYTTALLAWLTRPAYVTGTDVCAQRLARARERLAGIGYRPLLTRAAPTEGHPERGPYHRVLAHHPVPRLPRAWLTQCLPGALLAAPVAGALAVLQVTADGTAAGRLLPSPAESVGSLSGSPSPQDPPVPTPPAGTGSDGWPAMVRRTEVPGGVLGDPAFAFFAQLHLGGAALTAHPPTVVARDGSRARVTDRTVTVTGQRDLWAVVERAHTRWLALHRPRREWFEIHVTGRRQWIGYRTPDGTEHTWDLPADPRPR